MNVMNVSSRLFSSQRSTVVRGCLSDISADTSGVSISTGRSIFLALTALASSADRFVVNRFLGTGIDPYSVHVVCSLPRAPTRRRVRRPSLANKGKGPQLLAKARKHPPSVDALAKEGTSLMLMVMVVGLLATTGNVSAGIMCCADVDYFCTRKLAEPS